MSNIQYNSKYRSVRVSDLEGEYDTLTQPDLICILTELNTL